MKEVRAENATHSLELLIEKDPNLVNEYSSQQDLNLGSFEISDELFRMPDKINQALSFSASLVDQDHTGTWGDYGYIFNVPPTNILGARPRDLGSTNRSLAVYQALNKDRRPIDAPEEILRNTEDYNEIWAISSLGQANNIAIDGVFYKVDALNKPISPAMVKKLTKQAELLGVPVVTIPEPRTPDGITPLSSGWVLVQNGIKCEIRKNDAFSPGMFSPFQLQVSKRQQYFMSREHLDSALSILSQNGAGIADLQNINSHYQAADIEYHKPAITNIASSVSKVEKKIGYGIAEQTIHINSNGFGYRANSFKLGEYYSELVVCKEKPSWSPFVPLTSEDFDSIVREARMYSPQEADAISSMVEVARSQQIEPAQLTCDEMMKFVTTGDLH